MDPNYLPARKGLARAAWRKGDASAAAAASREIIARSPDDTWAWQRLAQALAAESRSGAPTAFARFFQEVSARASKPLLAETLLTVQIQQFGLEAFAGQLPEVAKFWREASGKLNARSEAEMRRQLAVWLFRAGRAIQAEQELQAARQRSPESGQIDTDLAWVLSDMGRQADAQVLAEGIQEDDEIRALKAVIAWRIDQRDRAKARFQALAERDPVWLEPKWIANTFSPATASVVEEMRTAELARRREEERRAAQRAGKAPQQPSVP
jgi:tetratricopeptide (TPR) repeat protein